MEGRRREDEEEIGPVVVVGRLNVGLIRSFEGRRTERWEAYKKYTIGLTIKIFCLVEFGKRKNFWKSPRDNGYPNTD